MDHSLFVEIGMGADLHGQNSTKASVRAVEDVLHRNSLPGISDLLNGDMSRMRVEVMLAVPEDADKVDTEKVKALFPYGRISCNVVSAGLQLRAAASIPSAAIRATPCISRSPSSRRATTRRDTEVPGAVRSYSDPGHPLTPDIRPAAARIRCGTAGFSPQIADSIRSRVMRRASAKMLDWES